MRRVLDLIVELFDQNRRASLLLGLLESKSFKSAFDQSLAKLPAALADLIVPVRALQAVVLDGKPNPADAKALADGLTFALKSGLATFEKRSARTRARLLETLATRAPHQLEENFGAALRLLSTLEPKSRERHEIELAIVRGMLALGREDRAKKRVQALLEHAPNDVQVAALSRALAAPRVGPFALLRGGNAPPIEHLNEAVLLRNQRPVWLRVAQTDQRSRFEAHRELHARLMLPGVARLLVCDTVEGRVFAAFERGGDALVGNHPLLRDRESALDAALQVVTFGHALAQFGLTLPDLNPRRFETASALGGTATELRLVNTWDLQSDDSARSTMLALARRPALLSRHLSDAEQQRLDACAEFETLLAMLDGLRWATVLD
jgi:hypothetical protein